MKFDKKTLPSEIKLFMETDGVAQAYTVSRKINDWLEVQAEPDVNTLFCAAHFSWTCATLTELDDDIVDFGEEAVAFLERILVMDASNEEALKNKLKLEKRIKKAKREQEAILKWEKDDVEQMSPGVISELAFYYFVKARRSPEFAEKGYRYYSKMYENDLLQEELPQDSLYHFATMAYCKYYAKGYEAAQELIEKTLNWELTERFRIYDNKITDVWMLQLNYLAVQNNFQAFETSFQRWYETIKSAKPDTEPQSTDYQNLTPIVIWLMSKPEGKQILKYILEKCYSFLSAKKIDLDNHSLVLLEIQKKLG